MSGRLRSRIALPRADYDALDAANYSTIKALARSPAHYRHGLTHRPEPTDAMRVGIATHYAVFEPDRCVAEIAVWPAGDRRGKAWETFREQHAKRTIIRQADADRAFAIAAAVRASPDVALYLAEGAAEVTALWTDEATGIACRARLDWIAENGAILDLKTTRDASPDAFGRQAWALGYHAQAAFYSDAVFAVTGERLPFLIVAVESEEPHVVQVYDCAAVLAAGRAAYRGWLDRLARCRAEKAWPGYAEGVIDLTLPRWADGAGLAANDEADDPPEEK